ncbi:MAG: OmpA family protein [Bacteroidota bacterium]
MKAQSIPYLFSLLVVYSCGTPSESNQGETNGQEAFDSLNKVTSEMYFDSVSGTYIEYSMSVERRESVTYSQKSESSTSYSSETESVDESEKGGPAIKTQEINPGRTAVRLPHHINTDASEYYPCPLPDGKLLFTGMDRTGHFEFKIDYSITRSAGGEDGFISGFSDGLPEDARPIQGNLNTNAHEAVTHVLPNGDYLMTANYQENLNSSIKDEGIATPDLFLFRNKTGRITHLPEPVNSLFGEYDGFMFNGEKAILFVSDRPGAQGVYKKKGWLWNENLWGNTDVYVAFKEEGSWAEPINLGPLVNTPHAERTPWLSEDGKTLYLSTNAYSEGRNDLDVFLFTRTDTKVWDKWTGPVRVVDVCSPGDDWCYRPDPQSGVTYFARSLKLKYKSSLPSREGDAYIRETGWRPGYTVKGAQAAALRREYQTDIFMLVDAAKPSITLPDVLFDVDSYKIKPKASEALDRLLDMVELNSKYNIEIQGHTDNTGSDSHNQKLSTNRAKAVRDYLVENGVDASMISVTGHGATKPVAPNNNAVNKQKNRRVEIYFKRGS